MEPSEGRQSLKKRSVKVVTGDVYPSEELIFCKHPYANMCKKVNKQRLVCVCVQNPKQKN